MTPPVERIVEDQAGCRPNSSRNRALHRTGKIEQRRRTRTPARRPAARAAASAPSREYVGREIRTSSSARPAARPAATCRARRRIPATRCCAAAAAGSCWPGVTRYRDRPRPTTPGSPRAGSAPKWPADDWPSARRIRRAGAGQVGGQAMHPRCLIEPSDIGFSPAASDDRPDSPAPINCTRPGPSAGSPWPAGGRPRSR